MNLRELKKVLGCNLDKINNKTEKEIVNADYYL